MTGATHSSLLYVDDEPDFCELVKVFLEATGEFTVATALSAREGCSFLTTGAMMP
jgi:CheY-like chemotaxis protein